MNQKHLRRYIAALIFTANLPAAAQVYPTFRSQLEPEFDKRSFLPSDITTQLPNCRRNDVVWRRQTLMEKNPSTSDWPLEIRKPTQRGNESKHVSYGAAQGVTWVDMDGDGWCDAIVSTSPEPEKKPGSALVISNVSCLLFYNPERNAYRPGTRGLYFGDCVHGEINSSFTLYYNRDAKRVEVVERSYRGFGLLYSSKGWKETHGRAMQLSAAQTRMQCEAGLHDACWRLDNIDAEVERVLSDLSESEPAETAIKNRLLKYRAELIPTSK
jgi:hypothetical protein